MLVKLCACHIDTGFDRHVVKDRRLMQIGICGTFDLQNYGDLLFPLIAEAELSRRLGPIHLHRFSYFERTSPPWPYQVTPVSELPKVAQDLDGLLIGGGDLIRFDKRVAPGYFPPTRALHHPTGYWLTPALICLQAGCPVAWNALGVFGKIPAWSHSLMHVAIGLSDYVAVRDDAARVVLAPFAAAREIRVVPDTCFGVARLLEQRRSSAFSQSRASPNLTRPYFLVQATNGLDAFARLMTNHRERYSGYQILALPVGPALGDDVACLRAAFPDMVELQEYPHPLLTAELIGGAAAVVGVSLHLSITAAVLGIPVFRPAGTFSGKYAMLSPLMNVHTFSADGEISPEWFEAKLAERGSEKNAGQVMQLLAGHWDAIAACFTQARRNNCQDSALLWQQLPGLLEAAAATADAETKAVIAERDERIGALTRSLADCDDKISGLTQNVTERDTRIAQLRTSAADHEQQAVAALEARDAELRASGDELRALYGSTSWKVTAPLRRIAVWTSANRTFPSRIIHLKNIARGSLRSEPYEWAFVNGLFSQRVGNALVRTYPHDHYKTVKGHDREKGYEYEVRPLIHMNAKSVSYRESMSECWQMLADDLLSPAYRSALSRLIGRDLSAAPMEAYVCHYGPGAWLGPHVDLKDKILTHVFYFNDIWDKTDGGCLQILRSSDALDRIDEVMPIVGNSSIIVRSENSWHAVAKVKHGCRSSRRSMNVIFYHQDAVSTMWPPGEQSSLHNYPQM